MKIEYLEFRIYHRVYRKLGDNSLSLRGFLQSVQPKQSCFSLVTKLNFARKCVPKFNLGTSKSNSNILFEKKEQSGMIVIR